MLFPAALVRVTGREMVDEWVRFTVQLEALYKRPRGSAAPVIRKGPTFMWVLAADLACKCPKVKTNK